MWQGRHGSRSLSWAVILYLQSESRGRQRSMLKWLPPFPFIFGLPLSSQLKVSGNCLQDTHPELYLLDDIVERSLVIKTSYHLDSLNLSVPESEIAR